MKLLEKIVSVIAPHDCLVCGTEGSLLCAWCMPDACDPLPSRCYRCQKVSKYSSTCANCRRKSKLSHVWVRTEYNNTAKNLLHVFKFGRGVAAADPIAGLMQEVLPYLSSDVIIVPVPTATTHVRMRGYDQAVLLAKNVAASHKLRCLRLLVRHGQQRQVGADRKLRLGQLNGAFRAVSPHIVKGAHILLVDDVLTTGATLEEAAKTLKAAGAKRIDAVVFAQR